MVTCLKVSWKICQSLVLEDAATSYNGCITVIDRAVMTEKMFSVMLSLGLESVELLSYHNTSHRPSRFA